MLLLAGMLFVSGCAENNQGEQTGAQNEEERVTPVEEVAATEGAVEPTGENADEGLVPGQEENSSIGGEQGMIPGEEEPGLVDNETGNDNNETVVQVAEDAGYTTFASLVRDAGLEDTLNEGTYTIFAPTNEAFDNLSEGMLTDLQNDNEGIVKLLNYHIVEGAYMSSDLGNVNSLTSLETGTLTVNATDNKVLIQDANVIEPDIIVNNSIIHGIDKVLIPPGM